MDDETLLRSFEDLTLPYADWRHRTHVKVAYLYLTRFSLDVAAEKMCRGIKAYNAAQNIPETPTGGYHETMTLAWVHLIHAAIGEDGVEPSADAFCDKHPELLEKHILRLFYSRERFMSAAAKAAFLPPDLTDFPRCARSYSPRQATPAA